MPFGLPARSTFDTLLPAIGPQDAEQSFLKHLQPNADAAHPVLPPPRAPGVSPFALPAGITQDAFQVTPTGQVATSYPNAETIPGFIASGLDFPDWVELAAPRPYAITVHTLNLKRYRSLPKPKAL